MYALLVARKFPHTMSVLFVIGKFFNEKTRTCDAITFGEQLARAIASRMNREEAEVARFSR